MIPFDVGTGLYVCNLCLRCSGFLDVDFGVLK